jgi:hypothetical protein
MSNISIGRVSHYLREYNCKAETTLCSPRRPGEGRLLILLQTHTEFSERRYFDAEAGRNAVSSWVCILWKIIRLISGPAQRERTVKCKKQVVGADFPEELETHLEGEAQRVLE